jgi:ribonuclease-3
MTIFDWLKQTYGIEVKDRPLMVDAFTHTSYVNENRDARSDNERLEFMGDAVMQIWVSERLFKMEPPISEGHMSKMRAAAVCEPTFAGFMRQLGLNRFLRLGAGEEKNGGRDRDSILADAFEAFIGALYLSNGMADVDKVLEPLIPPLLIHPEQTGIEDYKTELQEFAQADVRRSVKYVVLKEQVVDNEPAFSVGVYLDDVLLGRGVGHNKKQAEQNAARDALSKLVK